MVVLRPTRKLHAVLPVSPGVVAPSDTALGDWYVNRIVVDRRPLLILLSSRSLLAVLTPARDVRTLPVRLAGLVGKRLERLEVSAERIRAEKSAMASVDVARTTDRSVLGIMTDFGKAIPFYLETNRWDETTLRFVESRLGETPCYATRRFEEVIFPEGVARQLLAAKYP